MTQKEVLKLVSASLLLFILLDGVRNLVFKIDCVDAKTKENSSLIFMMTNLWLTNTMNDELLEWYVDDRNGRIDACKKVRW
jgi:hypothetical protein